MDDHATDWLGTALLVATNDIEPSPALDARVERIIAGRQRRHPRPSRPVWRRWQVPLLTASVVVLLVAASVVLIRTEDDVETGVVVTGPAPAAEPGWHTSAPSPLGPRQEPSLVWTGRELIVWGGLPGGNQGSADGAALDPATGRWRRIAAAPLAGRYDHVAVWTGREMIVWGGVVNSDARLPDRTSPNDGAAYDPVTDRWRPIAASPLPAPSRTSLDSGHNAVWAGTEMMIWGRVVDVGMDRSGAAYNPATDSWRPLPPLPGSAPRPTLVWTGEAVLSYPRSSESLPQGTVENVPVVGATLEADVLVPASNSWGRTPSSGIALVGHALTAVWTGEELIAVGESRPEMNLPPHLRTSGRYRPADGTWRSMAPMPVTVVTEVAALGWTGREVLAIASQPLIGVGASAWPWVALAYSPGSDSWRTLPVPEGLDRDLQAIEGAGGVMLWSGNRVFRYGS